MDDLAVWKSTMERHLDSITRGIIALIERGLPDDTSVRLRKPNDVEIVETRRGNDQDADYSSPAGPRGRTAHIPDPVGGEAVHWTHAVARALADLDELITDVRSHTDTITARGGSRTPPPPRPIPLEIDDERPDRGALPSIPNPQWARRALLQRMRWLINANANVYGYWQAPPGATEHDVTDVTDHWSSRAWVIERLTRRVMHRHGATTARDVRCANPRGKVNHPLGDDARGDLCGACRKAIQRANAT